MTYVTFLSLYPIITQCSVVLLPQRNTLTKSERHIMNMDTLVKQSLEAASKITGKGFDDEETQTVAFKLSCAAMAEELVNS